MQEGTPQPAAWDEAVSEATQHVADRRQAEDRADERQKPRSDAPRIAAALVALAIVSAWNVRALVRAPEPVPAIEERAHLAWFVADAVELVEDFRAERERLPNRQEATALFEDEDVTYAISGERYVLTMTGDSVALRYESATPLDTWLALEGAVEGEPPGDSGS